MKIRIFIIFITSIITPLIYLINFYIFKDILFTNPLSEWIISYITDILYSLIYILYEISAYLNVDLPLNQEIPNPYDVKIIKDNNNKLNNKHLVTIAVLSVMLFMIGWDIYNLMDNTLIEELYSELCNLEEAVKNNEKIMKNIEKILDDIDQNN